MRPSLGTKPLFWFASAAVFSGNALLAASRRDWLLVLLQAVTAVLALTAAWSLAGTGPAQPRAQDAPSARPGLDQAPSPETGQ